MGLPEPNKDIKENKWNKNSTSNLLISVTEQEHLLSQLN